MEQYLLYWYLYCYLVCVRKPESRYWQLTAKEGTWICRAWKFSMRGSLLFRCSWRIQFTSITSCGKIWVRQVRFSRFRTERGQTLQNMQGGSVVDVFDVKNLQRTQKHQQWVHWTQDHHDLLLQNGPPRHPPSLRNQEGNQIQSRTQPPHRHFRPQFPASVRKQYCQSDCSGKREDKVD